MYKELKDRMLEVRYKPLKSNIKIESASDCIRFFNIIWDENLFNIQEQFYVVYLDSFNNITCWTCLNTGSAYSCTVDVTLLIGIAFSCLASKIIVSHNHPFRSSEPSDDDKELTRAIARQAKSAGLELLDHIILSRSDHYSFREHGELK